MRRYRMGFSPYALALFLLMLMPNILWALFPPAVDPLATNSSSYPVLDILENGANILTFALLLLLINRAGVSARWAGLCTAVSGTVIVLYYVAWGLYYASISPPWMLLGMAIAPAVNYAAQAIRQQNRPAMITCVVYAALHIGITCANYLL